MAKQINKKQLDKIQRAYKGALNRAKKMKDKTTELAGSIQSASLSTGSAFALSYAQHRFRAEDGTPGLEVLGVPADLGLGLGLHLGCIFGVFGRYDESVKAVANGALATYATTMGAGMGTKNYLSSLSSADASQLPTPAPTTAGVSQPLTAESLRDLANF